ncbi:MULTISPECIES: hypothetical protein [Streptomyces]|uniref:hypothetical protein n=1 Tax=Streptomyces TaxID=1883 RepID=UPI001E463CB5|nr:MULTISPECIES: hypothetical protein [Streptomyces]UFQ13641.1 hypothetical protein J2N69_00655 [Streptomyces huasconensis]WCL83237.1 hypothetical protein PPN52_00645 [Streptomyces sp. JCM 35825]
MPTSKIAAARIRARVRAKNRLRATFSLAVLLYLIDAIWHLSGPVWFTAHTVAAALFTAALAAYVILLVRQHRARRRAGEGET